MIGEVDFNNGSRILIYTIPISISITIKLTTLELSVLSMEPRTYKVTNRPNMVPHRKSSICCCMKDNEHFAYKEMETPNTVPNSIIMFLTSEPQVELYNTSTDHLHDQTQLHTRLYKQLHF